MKYMVRLVWIVCTSVLAGVIALSILLALPVGRNFLVGFVNDTMRGTVFIDGVEGFVLSDFSVSRVDIKDEEGFHAEINGLHVKWHPLHLLTKRAVFDVVHADEMRLIHLPAGHEGTEESASSSFSMENILSFVPKHLMVDDLFIEETIVPRRQHLSVDLIAEDGIHHITVETREGPVTILNARAGWKDGLMLEGTLREDGEGILMSLLRLPKPSAIGVDFSLATEQDKRIVLNHLQAKIGETSLQGEGIYDPVSKKAKGNLSFVVPELAEWQELLGIAVQGDMKGIINVEGKTDRLIVTTQAQSKRMLIEEQKAEATTFFQETALNVTTLKNISYEVQGHAVSDVLLKTMQKARHIVVDCDIKGDAQAVGGVAGIQIASQLDKGRLSLAGHTVFDTSSLLASLSGLVMHGKKDFLLAGKMVKEASILSFPTIRIEGPGISVSGKGVWRDEEKQILGNAVLSIDDMQPLASALSLDMKGKLKATIKADVLEARQQADIAIAFLDMSLMKNRIVLRNPARIRLENGGIDISPFQLSAFGGTIVAEGKAIPEQLDGNLRFSGVPLDSFLHDYDAKAVASGDVRIKGTAGHPFLQAKTYISGKVGKRPVSVKAEGQWQEGRLVVDAKINSEKARMTARVDGQAALSFLPFRTDLSDKTPIEGKAAITLPLDMLNAFLWETRQTVKGYVTGDVTLGGILGKPTAQGRFVLKDGSYTHLGSGVCLNHVEATAIVSPDKIILERFTARDEGKGRLTAKVSAELTKGNNVAGSTSLRQLKLFCGGLAEGEIDGALRLTGSLPVHRLDGELTLGPLNVQLPGASETVGIPQIETIRMRDGKTPFRPKEEYRTLLHIALQAPNRIFVRGRGLDAEFGGKLFVRGMATSPAVDGALEAKRGTFKLFDRVLTLAKAALRFEGAIPPSPFLNVEATTEVKSTAIRVTMTGPARKPSFVLTSSPSLPQDEVLSLLLFGRQLQRISPFEALKLAQAARNLAGLDGGDPGILDQTRNMLGLDTLDIGSDDKNNMTLTTGKYVTDKVFVGVQQGAKPEDREIKTEITLTPSVSAKTTIDAQGNQGLGIGWRHDY